MKVTRRQLASRFVSMIGDRPLDELAVGLMAAAREAGYGRRDLGSIIAAVEREMYLKHSAIEVTVTTARELPGASVEQVADTLASAVGAASYTTISNIEPALLGGFEATASGTTIRNSIRDNLMNLNSGVSNG